MIRSSIIAGGVVLSISSAGAEERLTVEDLFQAEETATEHVVDERSWTTQDPFGGSFSVLPRSRFLTQEQSDVEDQIATDETPIKYEGEVGLALPQRRDAVRRSRSATRLIGTNPELVQNTSEIRIENQSRDIVMRSVFLDQDGEESITTILVPGQSESITIPTGSYSVRRETWTLEHPETVLREEFASEALAANAVYSISLSSSEQQRLKRQIDDERRRWR